jgi:hypothetical protein
MSKYTTNKFASISISEWESGTVQESPLSGKMLAIDPASFNKNYSLMTSAIAPRPIALLTTVDSEVALTMTNTNASHTIIRMHRYRV